MNPKLEGEDIGQFNEILTQVAALVIYGFSRPSTDDAAPVNGFEPEILAQAAKIVWFPVLLTLRFQTLTLSTDRTSFARMHLFERQLSTHHQLSSAKCKQGSYTIST